MSEFSEPKPVQLPREESAVDSLAKRLIQGDIIPKDAENVFASGLVDRIGQDAGEYFTMVHSTARKRLESILQNGFRVGDMPQFALQSSFIEMVPDTFPRAGEINAGALGYRHKNGSVKIIFQFPFEFPMTAAELGKAPLSYSRLREEAEDNPEDSEYFEEVGDTGEFVIPPRFIAGYIDLETGEAVYNTVRSEKEKAPIKLKSRLAKGALRLFNRN